MRAAMSSKLDEILSWGQARGVYIITLQEVKLLHRDATSLSDSTRGLWGL